MHHWVHVRKWSPELYQWESCTPGRSNKTEQVCGVDSRLKYAPSSSMLGVMQFVNNPFLYTSTVTETPTENFKDISALEEDGSPAGDKMKLGCESRIRLKSHEVMAIISTRTTITIGTCWYINEEPQSDCPWDQWVKVDRSWSMEACHKGVTAVLRSWKRWCIIHP